MLYSRTALEHLSFFNSTVQLFPVANVISEVGGSVISLLLLTTTKDVIEWHHLIGFI